VYDSLVSGGGPYTGFCVFFAVNRPESERSIDSEDEKRASQKAVTAHASRLIRLISRNAARARSIGDQSLSLNYRDQDAKLSRHLGISRVARRLI